MLQVIHLRLDFKEPFIVHVSPHSRLPALTPQYPVGLGHAGGSSKVFVNGSLEHTMNIRSQERTPRHATPRHATPRFMSSRPMSRLGMLGASLEPAALSTPRLYFN